ncbi:MAG: alcohol dehydrogenase catalytic domain-containing protein, partial [Planctomycetota bacterium]
MFQTEGFLISEHGGSEKLVWTPLSLPDPGPEEVKILVQYIGLNHLDLWVRRGVPGHKFPLPLIPGSDVVGVVEEVGSSVQTILVGSHVIVNPVLSCDRCNACFSGQHQLCDSFGLLGETRHGGCAFHLVVPFRNISILPTSYSACEMASFPLVFLTAWHMLIGRAQLRPTETVLVHAAGSGVGTAAIQIAKFFGAKVFTTVGSPEKMKKALELGADYAFNYQQEDWVQKV